MAKTSPLHPVNQGPSVERIELVNLLVRMAREAERQHPDTSPIAPLLRDLVNRAAAPPAQVTHDWDAIAVAAFRGSDRAVALVDSPRRSAKRSQPA